MSAQNPGGEPVIQELARGDGYRFGSHHNVLIASWTAQGTGVLIDRLARATQTFAAQHPEGFSSVHVIAKGLPLATGEARDRLIALMRKHAAQIACIGSVLEGEGFWASATRSFIIGLQMLAPTSFAMQTFAGVTQLAAWLPEPHARRTGVRLEAAALERAIAQLRTP